MASTVSQPSDHTDPYARPYIGRMVADRVRRSTDPPRSPLSPDPGRRRLTPREREIVLLVAGGLKDSVIAKRLGLATTTVGLHVSKALRRLRLDSRGELAAWVAARRFPDGMGGGLRRGEADPIA